MTRYYIHDKVSLTERDGDKQIDGIIDCFYPSGMSIDFKLIIDGTPRFMIVGNYKNTSIKKDEKGTYLEISD